MHGKKDAVFLLAVQLHTDSKTRKFKGIVTQFLHITVAKSMNTELL